MYVCVCNAITDREVHAAMASGAVVAEEVFSHFGTQVRCGRCVAAMRGVMGQCSGSGERRHANDAEPAADKKHKRCRGCTR